MRKQAPYKIQDSEGNVFVLAGYEYGEFPRYRTLGGCKIITDWDCYKILSENNKDE